MATHIRISGAGATSCNGDYAILNELKSGYDRVWMLGDTYRVYYLNGWKIANADVSTIFYKLVSVATDGDTEIVSATGDGIVNPWDTENCKWISVQATYAPIPSVLAITINDTISETYTETEADGTIVDVTKITNLSTGYVRYERVANKTVYEHEITTHNRYVAPLLMINRVYQFRFVSDFATLGYQPNIPESDPLKGIYRVDRMLTLFDLNTTGIDLFKSLYEPLGLSRTLYDKDRYKLGNTMVYKLTDVTDETFNVYMPLIFIEGTPDNRINQYSNVMMSIDIGTQFDTALLQDIKSIMTDVLRARWGLSGSVNLGVYKKTWLPETYYTTLVENREEVRKAIYRSEGNVLANELFYVEQNELYKKYQDICAKIAAYEEVITSNQ